MTRIRVRLGDRRNAARIAMQELTMTIEAVLAESGPYSKVTGLKIGCEDVPAEARTVSQCLEHVVAQGWIVRSSAARTRANNARFTYNLRRSPVPAAAR